MNYFLTDVVFMKMSVWCALMRNEVIYILFFSEMTIIVNVFLDMPELCCASNWRWSWLIFPIRWCMHIFCLHCFPGRWIWRLVLASCPARSPSLTPLEFYFWGLCQDLHLFNSSEQSERAKARIREAVKCVAPEIDWIWQELNLVLTCVKLQRCIKLMLS
jgi:hypothetical protein